MRNWRGRGEKAEQREEGEGKTDTKANTARPRTLVGGDHTFSSACPGVQNKERNTIDWKTPKT